MCGQVHYLHPLSPPVTNYSLKHRPKGHPFELPRYSYDLNRKSFVLRCLYAFKYFFLVFWLTVCFLCVFKRLTLR